SVHEILEKAGISIFEVDGYEADDLIGTLADQAQISKLKSQSQNSKIKTKDIEVIIVSGDRDMLQLVNGGVKVLAPIIGITKMILFDSEKVKEKYGINPSQIIDYKALVGDASDGYPGVPGIGPKTADNLLNEYETLENLYQNLEAVKQKNPNLAVKLAQGAEAAGLAKKLATIVTDAPINLDLEKCSVKNYNKEALRKQFEELGFKSLIKRLEETKASKVSEVSRGDEGKKKDENSGQLGLL
ncbi:DNA polymerase I, partial [Candidatus Microgenomates bacterium]